jgi:hypothetical protein
MIFAVAWLLFKGEIFDLRFYHQLYPPWTLIDTLNFLSKFGFEFVELSELKFDSLLHYAAGSKIFSLHDATGSQVNNFCRNLPAA